ncbi:MAG: DUF2130 domain-containing protein [Alistipes sp.]|nr:DUF2130 domain-containing protein [Alistipes sp.]
MKELKCPKCGTAITIDEADYAAILSQVRSAEFDAELKRRESEMKAMFKAQSEADMQRRLAEQSSEIGKREMEIAKLREQLSGIAATKDLEMQRALAERDARIVELNAGIANVESAIKIAVMEEQSRVNAQLQAKDLEIARLVNDIKNEKNEALIRENGMREAHKSEMQIKQQEVEFYRDLKSRLSTKMLGETLEEHCAIEFERSLRPHMPTAYFQKDNTVVEGTKGDFIYRDFDGETEYISIMFEMKNEADDTATKHKNADFLKKLDEDRRKKGCEYAILVSMLEPDSELYNGGIVDVSYMYEKMFVVRPQFFVPIITLLTQAAKKSIEYKRELVIARSQSVDVTNFENKLEAYKNDVAYNVNLAHKQFEEAIAHIDKSIKQLQDTREKLMSSGRNLRIANDKAIDMTIRKLTYKNPTMKQRFEDERKANGQKSIDED